MPQPSFAFVLGADDSGRGAIAGPVVVAMVYHPDPQRLRYLGATDSKKTTPHSRELFMKKLRSDKNAKFAYAATEAAWLNQAGTDDAEAQNVASAFDQLHFQLDRPSLGEVQLLMDGHKHYPNLPAALRVDYLSKGDGYVALISAASMVATYIRDQLIVELDAAYPGWDLAKNKGYDTEPHRIQLYEEGIQPFHHKKAARRAACHHAIKHKLPVPKWVVPVNGKESL